MTDIAALKAKNEQRWQKAKITRGPEFTAVAKRLADKEAKERYQSVASATGVPWFVIAVIHEREAAQSWQASIAQGDRWDRISIHVPRGRGPFRTWKEAAVDALVNCAPYAARWKDWSAGGTMTLLEQYNGLGYAKRGLPSPYIWSGTDQYAKGKYVADGVFDPDAVDKQLGCAGLLLAMQAIDASVTFKGEPAVPPPPDIEPVEPKPPSNVGRNVGPVVVGGGGLAIGSQAPNLTTAAVIIGVALIVALVVYLVWPKKD